MIVLTLCLVLWAGVAVAHLGGTNAEGCHLNRRTMDYHCHAVGKPRHPARATYCHVVAGGKEECDLVRAACRRLVRRYAGVCRREGDVLSVEGLR